MPSQRSRFHITIPPNGTAAVFCSITVQ